MRNKIISEIREKKIIAIVRGADEEQALMAARALYEGGIALVEVTFNQKAPETFANTVAAIKAIGQQLDGKVLVGAGTVTSVEQVQIAADAGAKYIISPDTDVDVIKKTRELGLVSLPGAYTPSEAKRAYNAGADFVKLFPCVGDAPSYIKAVCAPLNHIKFLAVGGVNEENAKDFFKAGAVGIGVGSNLVNKKLMDEGNYGEITERARRFVSAVNNGN